MAAHQALLSPGFSRQEYWSRLPFPSLMHACMLSNFSHVQLCVTPCTAAHQAPLSMGFSRQEYWSGMPFPSPFLFTLDLSCSIGDLCFGTRLYSCGTWALELGDSVAAMHRFSGVVACGILLSKPEIELCTLCWKIGS